ALGEALRMPRRAHWIGAAAVIEAWASWLGWWDHRVARRSHIVWSMIEGTKALADDPGRVARVGVVSVAYAGSANVLACIDAVKRNAYPDVRMVVVDNGGTGTADEVRALHPDVEVRRRPNKGLADAVNEGIRAALAAGCEHVIVLNDDVVVAGDFIAQA